MARVDIRTVGPRRVARTDDRTPGWMGGGFAARIPATGWTLVELMIVLVVASLLVTAAAPQYGEWIAKYQLTNAAEQLAASMNLARAEAIKRGYRVNLCPTADGRRCAGGAAWAGGWLVFTDINRNGELDDDEPLLRTERAAPPGVRVAANRPVDDYVSYTSLGNARLLNGALQMGTFTLCRPGLRALKVVLANSGRVRIETSRDACV